MAKAAQGTKGMTALIAQMIAMPRDQPIIRGVTTTNGRPSATAQPFLRPVLNWSTPIPAASAGKRVLPPDESIIIWTYDALCAMIVEDKNPTLVPLVQTWIVSDNPVVSSIPVGPGETAPLATDLYASIPAGAARAWHGQRLFARLFKGKYWNWCDCGQTPGASEAIQLFTGSVAMVAADAVIFSVYRLNEGDETRVSSTRIPGPIAANTLVQSVVLTGPDMYRVDITLDEDSPTTTLTFVVQNIATSAIMVHLPLPDLVERQMDLVQAIRILAATCNIKNTASEQNAAGSWVGDQIEGSQIWTQYIRGAAGANGFQKLSGQRGNEIMELKKNGYAFVTPEDMDDLHFVHPFTFNATGKVSNVKNEEIDQHPYCVFYLKAGGTSDASDPARSIQMLFDWGVEYLSEGQWPQTGSSPATADDWEAATKIVGSMENFYHNPAWKDILGTIGKYARLSAPVLALMGPYGKAASVVVGGVGTGLGMLGYRTKKTARQAEDERGDEARAGSFQKVEELACDS